MSKIAVACIGLIGLLHFGILYKEMFDWADLGPKLLPVEFLGAKAAEFDFAWATTKLAQNQGLYNGFLAAGLIWSLVISDPDWKRHIATFFLLCVAVAGVYGYFTIDNPLILAAQTGTSIIALAALHLTKPSA